MRTWAFCTLLVVSACVNNSGSDVTAFNADVAAARQEVVSYESSVTVAPAGTNCAADRDRYLAQLKPVLGRMRSMSIGFDGCMGMMQHREAADFQMMCTDLDLEVSHYASGGCARADPAANRKAALEHCGRMIELLDQAASQSAAMRSAMGGGMMSGCH